MAIVESIDSKMARSARNLIALNADFAAYYGTRGQVDIYRVHPNIKQEFIQLPMMTVQAVPERDAINRAIGRSFSDPTVHLRFVLFEQPTDMDINDGELSAVDYLRALEIQLMKGYSEDATAEGTQGKLINPDDPTSLNPKIKWLTTVPPLISREVPNLIDLSPDQDGSYTALVYPLIATYQTTLNPLTGARA